MIHTEPMKFNYQTNSNKSGIYKITNTIVNKAYIGSAAKFERRWYDHKRAFEKGTHRNQHLLNSFNTHGTDAFVFDVIEVMENSTKAERLVREEFHLQEIIKQGIEVYNSQLKPTKEAKERSCFSKTPEETACDASNRFTKLWADPSYKQEVSSKIKAFYNTEEGRQLSIERNTEAWKDSAERREKAKERMVKRNASMTLEQKTIAAQKMTEGRRIAKLRRQ